MTRSTRSGILESGMARWTLLLAGAFVMPALLVPGPLAGQSLLSGAGLGVRAEPLDARTRALGSAGVGLSGWHLSPTDPAAAAGLTLAAVTTTFQPGSVTPEDGLRTGHARFPLLAASYPLWGNVFSLQLASSFDQRWEVRTRRVLELSGVEVEAQDVYRSTGNLGRVQFGWARSIGEDFSVGATLGSHVGSIQRSYSRSLDPESTGPGVEPFIEQGRWRASGLQAGAGVSWDPSELLRLSTSVSWAGTLKLSPVGGSASEEKSYSMPLEFRAGAMATLVPGLALTGSVTYSDWSSAADEFGEDQLRGTTWSYGGGVEWLRAELLGRAVPIRVGARRQDLPFTFQGNPVSEQTISGGVGMHLVEANNFPAARFEVGVERGSRSAGPREESFLRATVTVRLAGG
jgi:opacity protein-like surface antigen